jgi:uncharacterized protein (DUF302 family)
MATPVATDGPTTPPSYGFGVLLPGLTMGDARRRTEAALTAEGFGVLTEIDVQDTLRQKLGVEVGPYLILGICNPKLAHRALSIEPYAGLLLPCNVTLWQEPGGVVVTIANPESMFAVLDDPRLRPIADEAEHRLRAAIERILI